MASTSQGASNGSKDDGSKNDISKNDASSNEGISSDIVIVGDSLAAVAAALAALALGRSVTLLQHYPWLGGQLSSQGVAALDEHAHIEDFGATWRYHNLRRSLRNYYQQRYNAPAHMPDGSPLNPGNAWVSRLCFEPKVAAAMLEAMLEPYVQSAQLRILKNWQLHSVSRNEQRISELHVHRAQGESLRLQAAYYLDASDTGALLPLVGCAYRQGAEAHSDTGEALAAAEAKAEEVQSFTYSFAVEYCPGEAHPIAKPAEYERFRHLYSLTLDAASEQPRHFRMFTATESILPFWSYRRLLDAALLQHPDIPRDVALINWAGNDYHHADLLSADPEEQQRILEDAKAQALGFLYWLQQECPRDDGGSGYPEFKLRPDIMGSNDGLSQAPYIRESRRIVGLSRIRAEDILAQNQPQARAAYVADSVGIGWYALDVHACVGNPDVSFYLPTRPFQIPLGALIPHDCPNVLAACKNISSTHLSSGAYRVHPVEWAIGEAAGTVAAYCVQQGQDPEKLRQHPPSLAALQLTLLRSGIPLVWLIDLPLQHPDFVPLQWLFAQAGLQRLPELAQSLRLADVPFAALQAPMLALLQESWLEPQLASLRIDACADWRDVAESVSILLQQLPNFS